MARAAWEALAALSLGAVVYSYALYPLLLIALAALRQASGDVAYVWRKADRRRPASRELPRVDVIVAAFNERAHIAARIANLLEQDYPADRLRVLVGSDGSNDGTDDILRGQRDPRVDAQVYAVNRGKSSVLNDLVARASAPILVFSDANTDFDAQAIRRLVAHFDREDVGAVSGELRLRAGGGDNRDSLYWRYEQVLKLFEARLGALLGANGAIYAIRRELWTPLRPDTICDDFCVAMNVSARRMRVVYEPEAWAEEDTPPAIADEYRRRVRIGIGNFQALVRHPGYVTQTSLATSFAYISHKVLRWIAPHLLLLGLFASAVLAWDSPAWGAFALLQAAGYIAAALLWRRSVRGGSIPASLSPLVFLFALNWAFLVASVRYARGNYRASWKRTQR